MTKLSIPAEKLTKIDNIHVNHDKKGNVKNLLKREIEGAMYYWIMLRFLFFFFY